MLRNTRIIAAIALLTYVSAGRAATQVSSVPDERRAPNKALSRLVVPGTQELELIVRLSSPSVVESLQAGMGRQLRASGTQARHSLQSSSADTYRRQAAAERLHLVRSLESIAGVRVEAQTETVLNSVIVRAPLGSYREVVRLPGVKKVYISRPHRMLLDAAATQVGAQGLWTIAGGKAQAGRGAKIGIIDSGIDITHPMFSDSSLTPPQGFPRGDTSYTNSKVIVARSYVTNQAEKSPVDEAGHGTFVAAIAAGKEVSAPHGTISGMAPGAFLGSYKVFGTPGINDTASTGTIIRAIDEAVADGMDVINLSLGALDYLPPSEDPEQDAIQNAIAAGVVVTISAGNDGPETHTISSPGTTPDAITVGSVSNSRMLASPLRVTAPAPVPSDLATIGYNAGNGPKVISNISPTLIVDVAGLDGDGYGCSSFQAGSLSAKIALIQRGGTGTACTFLTKVDNAAAAGASAVVVYNNVAPGVMSMGGLEGTSIPAVSISKADGVALKTFIAAHPGVVQVAIDSWTTLVSIPTAAAIVSSFAAVGPGMDFSIKPDLVAVGENVYSATQSWNANGDLYDPAGYTSAQGTSFSAPMVAGAAAALRQLFPGLGPLAIKSILTSTASRQLTADGSRAADVLHAGSGLLNMGAAAAAGASFAPSALNFGTQAYDGSLSLTRSFQITNISSSTDRFTLTVDPLISGATAVLSRSDTGQLAGGASAGVDVTLQVGSGASRGFQGFVTVTSSRTGFAYRIPYWAGLYTPDSSRTLTITQAQGAAGSYGTIADALRAARPGNALEIADSSTYSTGVVLATNGEGLPLHGLSIRARGGESPVLDGSKANTDAVVQLIGVRDVSLRGITITGGSVGVLLSQPSASYPVSATIDRCTITGATDASSAGVAAQSGGSLNLTQSRIANCSGSGVLADGAFVTVVSSTIEQNASDGIDAYGSNLQVLHSTVASNTGPGLNLDTCSGTIDGSSLSKNRGAFGDGFDVTDSSLTITNNTFDSNERAGMGFFDFAGGERIRAAGNRIQANSYGVLANPGDGIVLDGNLVSGNGRGIRLTNGSTGLLYNNIVVRSTGSGNAVEVNGSSARIVNNTIYQNALRGVSASGGLAGNSVTILNSVVAANSSGDLDSIPQDNVRFSLIGDGTFATVNNNMTGDPRFVDPDANDFRPAWNSPLLDAGSNDAADLTWLDCNEQLRVASSTSPVPSDGKVDIGAAEANSSYPLIFPVVANGSQSAFSDSVYTGYAVVNNGASGTSVRYAAFNAAGAALPGTTNPYLQSIDPGHQEAKFGFQLFGYDMAATTFGSVLADSVQPVSGFFLVFDQGFEKFSIGANAIKETGPQLYFTRHLFDASGKAAYAVFNPGLNSADVTATLISTAGTPVGSAATVVLPPKGQCVFTFENVTTSSGYVRVQSDRPVAGLEIFGKSPVLSVLNATVPGTESRLFFPHVAMNEGFTSLLGIVNSSGLPSQISLSAFDSSGRVIGTPTTVSLAPDAQLLDSVGTLFGIPAGQLTTGYIVAESDQPGIQGFTQFVYDDGRNKSATAVPADSVPRQHLVFSHIAHQYPAGSGGIYLTGIGLLNPFGAPVDYTLKVFSPEGVKIREMTSTLGPREKLAKMLSHPVAGAGFFPGDLPLRGGHVEVDSEYGLLGFELFFTDSFSQLASVPPQQ